VRETLRLYPPAWVIGRQLVEPFEIGGFQLLKNDQIMMSPYVMQRDGRYFEEPESFRPERWLDQKSESLPRFAYFPFGGGQRVCIGNHFATMEAKLVLGALIQRLELTVVPGFPLAVDAIVTLRPKHGVRVKVKTRGNAPGRAA
jgi:cytochrome P450